MSERDWFYPPEGWPVHELNPEWYKRKIDLEAWDPERPKQNALCIEIDQAGVSSKRCCSRDAYPPEAPGEKEKREILEVVRFVRGLGGPRYPEMWGLEVLGLEIRENSGWTASLALNIETETCFGTWRELQHPLRITMDDYHHIYVGSEDEKRRLLEWFQAFSQRHGFHTWEKFPIKEQRLDLYEETGDYMYRWTREGQLLNIEYPKLITSVDITSGAPVTIQANPRFDEYMEFCRAQRLRGAFTFNEEPVLMELEADPKWRPRVEAYRSYLRGRYQDDVARDLGVGQSTVSTWLAMVRGEISRRMGAAYEVYLEGRHRLRPDVSRVTRDGAQGRPDLVVELRDGSYEVISAKCFKSDRSTVTVQLEEFQPELNEAHKLTRLGEPVRLLVDYLNLETGQHEVTEINLDNPPQRLNFRKPAS